MGAKDRQQQLEELTEPVCNAHGVELVEVRQIQGPGGWTLRITIDRARDDDQLGSAVNVDDCANVSRDVSTALDVHEDIMPGAFHLEVSSPGLERPLIKLSDFERFAGQLAMVRTGATLEGRSRRKFEGVLRGVDGAQVRIEQRNGVELLIPHEAIERAHLVPSF